MNTLGRTLLLVGALVLAVVAGVLIGRAGRRSEPTSEGNAAAVQITTAPPPSVAPPTPLPAPLPAPAPVKAPETAPILKVAPEAQVQEDAAAVGMTTNDTGNPAGGDAATVAPKSTGAAGADAPPPQPNG